VFTTLQKAFPHTPIISIFGNNDSFEKDYGKFIFKGMSTYNMANQSGFKNGFLSSGTRCDNIMPYPFPCIFSQNHVYGFFSVKIQTNLLLIGLNTVMFSPYHNAKPHEIKVQMEYLKTHLELARASGISVLIAMHIPVGKNVYDGTTFWKKSYQDTFLKLIRTYLNQIKGLLVSHTHMEEFKIIKVPSGQDIGEFFTAGLSTSHGNSPSVKVFQLKNHEEDWEIQNYITYQIHEKNDEIVISKFYDFLSTYCVEFPSNIRSINSCLSQIKFNQTLPRFTVNNPNFEQNISSPEAFYVN
jgi:alkaline phosphatase D